MRTHDVSMALVNVRTERSGAKRETSQAVSFDQALSKSSSKSSEQFQQAEASEKKGKIQDFSADKRLTVEKKEKDTEIQALDGAWEAKVGEVLKEAIQFVQDALSFPKEDMEELLELFGIQFLNLLIPVDENSFQLNESAFSSLKQLLMDYHGLEDETAFLIDSGLVLELDKLKEGLETILNGQEVISPKQFLQFVQEKAGDLELEPKEVQVESETSILEEPLTIEKSVEIQVAVEQNGKDGASAEMKSSVLQESTERTTGQSDEAEIRLADVFTEKLNEAFRTIKPETADSMASSPADVVRQVVNHIRVRVLPETTRLEISLHPEHLGRVNISVSQSAGVTTATLLVQNEAAKEALESQILTLRETFEEKGLKVESVEVAVSDFGFKKEEERKGDFRQENKTKRNLIRMEDGEEAVEEAEEETGEAVVSYGRTIDYTA